MDVKQIREMSGLSQGKFSERYGIPIGTLHHWETGERKPPGYLLTLLESAVRQDLADEEELKNE